MRLCFVTLTKRGCTRCESCCCEMRKSSLMLLWESTLQETPLIEGAVTVVAATSSICSFFLTVGRHCDERLWEKHCRNRKGLHRNCRSQGPVKIQHDLWRSRV